MAHLKEHHAEVYVEAFSAQKLRERVNSGAKAVDRVDTSTTGTNKHSKNRTIGNVYFLLASSTFYLLVALL